MDSIEREPLLNEKTGHNDRMQSNNGRLGEARSKFDCQNLSDCLRRIVLLSVICGLAVYGSYSICKQQLSNSIAPAPTHGHSASSNYSCLPGQPCWPSKSEWSAFNESIDGRLKLMTPWAVPCFHNSSSEQCKEVAKGYGEGVSRTA
jgi:hypothetical protein